MTPTPFIKSAGGKGAMLSTIAPLLPAFTGTYHEPCAGGAAALFALAAANALPNGAHLGDANAALVAANLAVRDHLPELIARLTEHATKHEEAEAARIAGMPKSEHYYYEVRCAFNANRANMTCAEAGACFIYMNKVCFNGLWREGPNGFNTPLGAYKNPTICDEPNLRACSEALQNVKIRCEDFSAVLGRAQSGDLVYFDPPYAPTSNTSKFTNYTAGGFGEHDHARMAKVAAQLKQRGVGVVISNSDTTLVRRLYATGFEIIPVQAPRSMAARGGSRGRVQELVIR
jgi:DNA adenine methylase